jgi:hypothetical protein
LDWLIALLGAIGVGALGNLAYELVKNGTLRAPRLLRIVDRSPRSLGEYDVRIDGLTPLVTWSRHRPLTRRTLRTDYVGRLSRSHLFDQSDWHERVAENIRRGDGGRTCYIEALTVDHGEHEAATICRVSLAESSYPEAMATHELAKADSGKGANLHEALETGMDSFLRLVPPTSLSFSVAVVSKRNRTLALRRSLSVRTYANRWSIGINETMKYSTEPGAREDFFGLIERGLFEELGVDRGEYSDPVITWLGWSQDACCFHGVAIVRLRIEEVELEQRRGACHSVYEHDALAWLRMDKGQIWKIIEGRDCPDGTGNWLYLSPLVAQELWRNRGLY